MNASNTNRRASRALNRAYTLPLHKRLARNVRDHWELYLIMVIPLALLITFSYVPMYGIQIAFKNFHPRKGITGSDWVGFKYFVQFFRAYDFWRIIGNTLTISGVSLLLGFPMPILLAIALNECKNLGYKKTVQMTTYAPHFISTVVMVSMLNILLSQRGIINSTLMKMFGFEVLFMGEAWMFKYIYALSGVWQGCGYGAVIYIAALSGIDPQLHEAAIIDGASKVQRIAHIDLPGILPTAVILLILNCGSIMNVGFEKTFLMQNPVNLSSSDVISTHVYRRGLIDQQFSYATAVGLFNSVVGMILIMTVNWVARRMGETSLW